MCNTFSPEYTIPITVTSGSPVEITHYILDDFRQTLGLFPSLLSYSAQKTFHDYSVERLCPSEMVYSPVLVRCLSIFCDSEYAQRGPKCHRRISNDFSGPYVIRASLCTTRFLTLNLLDEIKKQMVEKLLNVPRFSPRETDILFYSPFLTRSYKFCYPFVASFLPAGVTNIFAVTNYLLTFTKNLTDGLFSKHVQIKQNGVDSNAFKTMSRKSGPKKHFFRRNKPPPFENNVTHWQHCPKIYLPASYHLNHCDFEICIKEYDICFESHMAKFDQEDTAIALCLDDYKRIVDNYMRRTTGEDSTETYFSVICLSVSSIGCLLTVTKSLVFWNTARTLPTPLTIKMTLSFTLFLANTFYTASRFFIYIYPVCMVLGIASHYLWLLVLSLMTTLCFDLFLTTFRIFKSRYSKSFLTYLVANITLGLVIVAIHIRLSYVISGGSSIGYSKTTCFIENGLLKFFTLLLPVSLMVFLNTLLVFVTIFFIKRKISFSNSRDKQILKIYFKLSTITGMTWIFGLLYEIFGIPFFIHVHSFFNGSIGIFMFAAFGYQIDS
ncbi:uncharacterized protein LOC134281835 [Saccostrea cucullata]|uniref:uncharacterized protein LOC134281835 n=1 Tax=Saccostrea cuccullata TaxID=36930 RepID=UPI002ED3F98B